MNYLIKAILQKIWKRIYPYSGLIEIGLYILLLITMFYLVMFTDVIFKTPPPTC